jgi:hypothetical protein
LWYNLSIFFIIFASQKVVKKLGTVAQGCNSSYVEDRDLGLRPAWTKVNEIPFRPHLWWSVPVFPVTTEIQSQSRLALGKNTRPYLKNHLKQKDKEVWLK